MNNVSHNQTKAVVSMETDGVHLFRPTLTRHPSRAFFSIFLPAWSTCRPFPPLFLPSISRIGLHRLFALQLLSLFSAVSLFPDVDVYPCSTILAPSHGPLEFYPVRMHYERLSHSPAHISRPLSHQNVCATRRRAGQIALSISDACSAFIRSIAVDGLK